MRDLTKGETMKLITTAALLSLLAAPAFADEGDVAKGEKEFNKCKACHAITDADGTAIIKGGKTGPDLHGIVGREIAAVEDFKYGDGILALKEKYPGGVWDHESLKAYVTDPTGYLDEYSGNPKAKSKMTFKLTKNQDDVIAYLASVSPNAGEQVDDDDAAPAMPAEGGAAAPAADAAAPAADAAAPAAGGEAAATPAAQ